MAFVTNLVTAVINILLNYFLIQRMGILGAAIATAISYFVFWIYRVIDCQKIVRIRYHVPVLVWNVGLLLIQTIIMTLEYRYWIPVSIVLFLLILITETDFGPGANNSRISSLVFNAASKEGMSFPSKL